MKNSNMAQNELWFLAHKTMRTTNGIAGNSISCKDHVHFQIYRNEDEDGVWYSLEEIEYHFVGKEGDKGVWSTTIYQEFKQFFDFLEYHSYIHYVYDEWDDHVVGISIDDDELYHLFVYLHYMNTYKWDLPIVLDISAC